MAPGKLVKVSERRATVQQVRVHERISSVEGNGSTKRNFQPRSDGLIHDDALRNSPTKRTFQGNGGNTIKLAPSQLNVVETKSVNTNSSGQPVKTFRPERAKVQPQSQQEKTSSLASKVDSRTILDMNSAENLIGKSNMLRDNRDVQMLEQIRTRTQSTPSPSVQLFQKVQKAPVQKVQTAPVQKVQKTPVQKVQKAPAQKVQKAPVQKVQKAPAQKVQTAPVQKVQTAPVQKVQKTPVQKVQTAPVQKVQATPVQKKDEDEDEDKDKDKDKDKDSSTKKKRSK